MSKFILTGFADEAAQDLYGQIKALQDNQMSFVELRMIDGESIADISQAKAKEVKAALQKSDIGVSCLGSPMGKINLADSFGEHLEMMRRLCETAHILATDKIRVFSFYLPENQTPEQCREEVIERLGRLIDIAVAESCVLLHENERDIYGDIWERCLDLHKAFGEKLRGILDPANYLLVGSDPLAAMQELFPWIDYLHIKDVRLKDQRIVPAGEGDGRIPEILELMRQKPGQHFLSVEPHLTHFAGRDQLEKDSTNTPAYADAGDDYTYRDSISAFTAAVRFCRRLID